MGPFDYTLPSYGLMGFEASSTRHWLLIFGDRSYPLPHQVGVRVGAGKRFALSPNHLLLYLISLFITAESEPATTQRYPLPAGFSTATKHIVL